MNILRKKVKGEIVVGIMMLLLLAGILFNQPNIYEGKLRLDTADEYTAFKEAIAQPHVNIDKIVSLSSEPPIIIDFSVKVPRSQTFPYGVVSYHVHLLLTCIIGGIGLSLIIIPLLPKNQKEEPGE